MNLNSILVVFTPIKYDSKNAYINGIVQDVPEYLRDVICLHEFRQSTLKEKVSSDKNDNNPTK